MSGKQALNDMPSAALMTDEELYALHLQAAGLPKKKHGGAMLRTYLGSSARRILTATDTFLYLFLALCTINLTFSLCCLVGIMLCAINIDAGPLSFAALAMNWYLDLIPLPRPSAEVLGVGSPESISLVADYLGAPIIKSAEGFVASCEDQLAPIDRLLGETGEIEARILRERDAQKTRTLTALYDHQISEAREAVAILRSKRDELLRQQQFAQSELESLKAQLYDMRVLAHASYQLRVVREQIMPRTQAEDEETATNQLARVCEKIKGARDCVQGLQAHAVARASALAEVNHLHAHR